MKDNVRTNAEKWRYCYRHSGWYLALLVARSVEPGEGQGKRLEPCDDRREVDPVRRPSGKVSARKFAELTGTSDKRIMRYLRAWERAADAGVVSHHAAELDPAQIINLPTMDRWDEFFDGTKTPSTAPAPEAVPEPEAVPDAIAEALADTLTNPLKMRRAVLGDPEVAHAAREAVKAHDAHLKQKSQDMTTRQKQSAAGSGAANMEFRASMRKVRNELRALGEAANEGVAFDRQEWDAISCEARDIRAAFDFFEAAVTTGVRVTDEALAAFVGDGA